MNDELRFLYSIPLPEADDDEEEGNEEECRFNVKTLFAKKKDTAAKDERLASLGGEGTVYRFRVPDPAMVAAGDSDCNLKLNIRSPKGEATKIGIIIPHLDLTARYTIGQISNIVIYSCVSWSAAELD